MLLSWSFFSYPNFGKIRELGVILFMVCNVLHQIVLMENITNLSTISPPPPPLPPPPSSPNILTLSVVLDWK